MVFGKRVLVAAAARKQLRWPPSWSTELPSRRGIYVHIVTIGASGQVARALVEYGSRNSVQVTALGRPNIDLTKPDIMHSVIRAASADVIVNAGAYTAVDNAEQNQDIAYDVNARGPTFLARCARDLDIPLIHLSTDYVFDGEKDEPYTEEDPI